MDSYGFIGLVLMTMYEFTFVTSDIFEMCHFEMPDYSFS